MQTGALHRTVILTMLALCALATPRAQAESAESLARKGNSLYKQGKYDEAAEAYRQALMRSPGDAVIKYNLGTALGRTGNIPDAQKALTEAAETPGSPRRGDSYYNLGTAQAESTKKKPEDQGQQGAAQGGGAQAVQPNDPMSAGPGLGGGVPQAGAPDPVAAAQQKVAMLEQSLDSFRKSILTNSHDENYKYNYETVLEMLKQARQQLEQEKQQQQQGGGKQGNKDNKGQQNGQNQKDQKGQQGQQPQNGQKNGQQQGQGQKPGDQKNGQQGQGAQDGKGQMTPEQIDALGLLNMLESEKPEQFKQLYRFRGEKDNQKHPTKDW